VFPFVKFPGVDTILGPEMKSTGEVMGVGKTFGEAFVKSQMGAGERLPEERRNAIADSRQIRTSSLLARVTTFTTIAGARRPLRA
jgi:carbamoylphosphate synthase large subunit